MRPLRLALAAASLLALAPRGAEAQSTEPAYASPAKRFVAVDAVSIVGCEVVVTGIVQGEATPSTWSVSERDRAPGTCYEWAAMCHRTALVAMSAPGRYLLEIEMPEWWRAPICTLRRANP